MSSVFVDTFDDLKKIISEPQENLSFEQESAKKIFNYHRLLKTLNDSNEKLEKEEVLLIEKLAISDNKPNVKGGMTIQDEDAVIMRNILIWVPIGLALILIFCVNLLAFMPIPKSTILHATYITNKMDRQ